MALNEAKLGYNRNEVFDTHDTGGEHATRSLSDFNDFRYLLKVSGQHLDLNSADGYHKYLASHEGYYFRALAKPQESANRYSARSEQISGAAIDYDQETQIAEVAGIYNKEADKRVDDAQHYLWLTKILPNFTFTNYPKKRRSHGLKTSKILFGDHIDEPTTRLLQTFGLYDETEDEWSIPLPDISVVGPSGELDTAVGKQPPPKDKSVAVISEGYRVQYFEDGERLGVLSLENADDRVVDAEQNEIGLFIPDHIALSDMSRLFESDTVRSQMGYVALKRSLQTSK